MSVNPYSPPVSDLGTVPIDGLAPALWTPSVTAVLGFFLSPVFGGLVLMKNWQAMGEPDKASKARWWAIGSVGFYLAVLVAAFVVPDSRAMDFLFQGVGLAFFIAWYMMCAKEQKDVVEYRYGQTFPKRSWLKPVLYAIGVYIGLIVALVIGIIAVTAVLGPST